MSQCIIPTEKNNQHVDFPSGHPPEYYPRLSLVNFAERTGCSSFRLIWPIEIYCGYFVAYIFFSTLYIYIYMYMVQFHYLMVRSTSIGGCRFSQDLNKRSS